MSTEPTDPVDWRQEYIAITAKVYRTGLYYELCSKNYRTKANGTGDPIADAVSKSLARAAEDMDFVFRKACRFLSDEDRQRIIDENPTPFTSVNIQRKAA
jgi:hypothetical protein